MEKTAYKTKQQNLLFSYLEKTKGKHFTAEDVYSYFSKKEISIGIATIYRRLEKLVSEGQVQKYFIDEHSAACFEYSGNNCKQADQHFHLKCEQCLKLFHLECDDLKEVSEHLQSKHKFLLNPYRTVFYGICKTCATTKKRGTK